MDTPALTFGLWRMCSWGCALRNGLSWLRFQGAGLGFKAKQGSLDQWLSGFLEAVFD